MPTFDDPLADARESAAGLRALAHATRAFADPADMYEVVGELLSGVRSLHQVLDQLASGHETYRSRALDDAGDPSAGAVSSAAAAAELRRVAALVGQAEHGLDLASQHAGRVAWAPTAPPPVGVTSTASSTMARAGSLALTVWPDTPLGEHQRYAYRVDDAVTGETVQGRDLFTGAGAPVDAGKAIRELAAYLAASGEARQYLLENPGSEPENAALFPVGIAEAARGNLDELTLLTERGPDRGPEREPVRRWVGVVFLQGGEADVVLDLLQRDGPDAAIEHLAGYDNGEETTRAALENGDVHETPPVGRLESAAERSVAGTAYTLVYSPFLGHVNLLREDCTPPDPALCSTSGTVPVREARAQETSRGRPAEPMRASRSLRSAEWFSGAGRSASQPVRGLSL